jgi:hypothetical protein
LQLAAGGPQAGRARGGPILALLCVLKYGGRQDRCRAGLPQSNRRRPVACPPARPSLPSRAATHKHPTSRPAAHARRVILNFSQSSILDIGPLIHLYRWRGGRQNFLRRANKPCSSVVRALANASGRRCAAPLQLSRFRMDAETSLRYSVTQSSVAGATNVHARRIIRRIQWSRMLYGDVELRSLNEFQCASRCEWQMTLSKAKHRCRA